MNLKDVKALTIPQGSVKKITDSNGNVIWGNPSDFPYRRLEYIHLNGAEYINTGLKPSNKNFAVFHKLDSDATAGNARVLGYYDGSVADASRRCYMIATSSGGYRFALGNTWSNTLTPAGWAYQKIKQDFTMSADRKTIYAGMRDPEDNTSIDGVTTSTTAAVGTNSYFAIGTNFQGSSAVDTTAMYKGNIYQFQVRTSNASGALEHNQFACQRKSDGVCGLYDTITSTFYPLIGTTITDGAAGPILDEYWDLTAPA